MEHTDLHKLVQTLLPIAIFALWAMFSKPARKKRKERAEQENRQRQNENDVPDFQQQEMGTVVYHEQNMEILKESQSLEDVSTNEEESLESKDSFTSAPEVVLDTPAVSQKSTEKLSVDLLTDLPQNKISVEKVLSENAYAQSVSPINSQTAYSIATPATGIPAQGSDMATCSTNELRKIIVWSEILGKPVGLRDIE
ncbi:MAG TPA: hypothetical protein DCO75_00895 [Fibrobacteres bacterium]|nr:hypothetical protein [Fibrobacterota bacterium]